MTNQLKPIVDFKMTPGNVADNNEFVILDITKNILGQVYGEREYFLNIVFFLFYAVFKFYLFYNKFK